MDYSGGYSGGNVVQIMPGGDNWMQGVPESAVWATEDEYRVWNSGGDVQPGTPSNSNHDQRPPSQTRSGSEPPNKKTRSSQDASAATSNRSKAIGKMFFKTKLCCKFRAGTCPYVTNCNFAHSIEELRRPPPNWQEIVAAHEEDRGVSSEPPREEFQIPSVGSTNFAVETPRSSKGRHCKKFYSEEGCPYGESCTFLHDEQSKNRESVVISLGPGGYGAGGGGGGGGGSGGGGGGIGGGGGGGGGGSGSGVVVVAAGAAAPSGAKPSNWKTRICNKWELTGYCPFGSKCHFAHGAGELHRYGGGLVDTDGRDSSTAPPDSKQGGVPSKNQADIVVASVNSAPHSDGYHMGLPSQRSSLINQRPGQRALHKWKGPNKISRIYGDWIDDIE